MKLKAMLFLVIIVVLVWAPWVTPEKSLSIVLKKVTFEDTPEIKKTLFGIIIKGQVSVCPICPAFSNRSFLITPFYTVIKL